MTARHPEQAPRFGLPGMFRRIGLVCLAGCMLALSTAASGPCQTGADGDVGYSTGADTPAPPPARDAGKDKAAGDRPEAPALSITLEGYGKKDEPAPPPRAAPERAVPETPPSAVSPAPATPAPRPRDLGPGDPGASAVPSGSSPVTAMLGSTLRGDYATTRNLARRMPQKRFDQIKDKSLARNLSKQGNDLLNKKDDPPAALEAYQAAYANDPSSSEIAGSYGYALFRNGRFAEARDMESQCLEIAPEYAAAWFVLGQIYGYLKQEDMAYASFVNTCLFTKNISTSLGFLEREIVKYGEVTVQQAAARALETCRRLSTEGPAARPAPAEPAPMRQGAGPVSATPMDVPAAKAGGSRPASPEKAAKNWKSARIGKVDLKAALTDSRLFSELTAKLVKMPKAQRDAWLDSQIGPVLEEVRGVIRAYAKSNNYLLVIQTSDEAQLRRGDPLRKTRHSLSEMDDDVLAFLNSPEGLEFRRTADIKDLTAAVAAQIGTR
jgi:hypothetical protein